MCKITYSFAIAEEISLYFVPRVWHCRQKALLLQHTTGTAA